MPLKPIEIDVLGVKTQIQCKHKATWPPMWAKMGFTSESMRGDVEAIQYERARTWETVCGLMEMSAHKCASCPYAILDNGKSLNPQDTRVPVVSYSRHFKKKKNA